MYKINITAKAKKELKVLEKKHQLAIGRIIEELKEEPYLGKPLRRELTERFSFRVGVYRIIYKVNKKDAVIDILTAGHRSTVYE